MTEDITNIPVMTSFTEVRARKRYTVTDELWSSGSVQSSDDSRQYGDKSDVDKLNDELANLNVRFKGPFDDVNSSNITRDQDYNRGTSIINNFDYEDTDFYPSKKSVDMKYDKQNYNEYDCCTKERLVPGEAVIESACNQSYCYEFNEFYELHNHDTSGGCLSHLSEVQDTYLHGYHETEFETYPCYDFHHHDYGDGYYGHDLSCFDPSDIYGIESNSADLLGIDEDLKYDCGTLSVNNTRISSYEPDVIYEQDACYQPDAAIYQPPITDVIENQGRDDDACPVEYVYPCHGRVFVETNNVGREECGTVQGIGYYEGNYDNTDGYSYDVDKYAYNFDEGNYADCSYNGYGGKPGDGGGCSLRDYGSNEDGNHGNDDDRFYDNYLVNNGSYVT